MPNTHFSFSNLTRYTGHYRYLDEAETIPAAAPSEVVDAYVVRDMHDVWIFDWTFEFGIPLNNDKGMQTLSLEIYNVFDEESRISTADSDYFLGRQYWGKVSYRF